MITELQLQRRSMVVKRLKVFPIESIVRGYITGSAWSSYQKDGTVCGISLPIGLQESQQLPQPLWTPSTKAELGGKDENISPAVGALPIKSHRQSFYPCSRTPADGFKRQRPRSWAKVTPIKSRHYRSKYTTSPVLMQPNEVSSSRIPSSSLG